MHGDAKRIALLTKQTQRYQRVCTHSAVGSFVSEFTLAGVGAPPLQFFSGDFLTWAIAFFILAVVAALVGARGLAGVSMEIARIFVVIFTIIAIVALIL